LTLGDAWTDNAPMETEADERDDRHAPLEEEPSPATGHMIVCGLGRFGLRIVERLRERGLEVVVITDARATRPDRKKRCLATGARLVEGDFRFADVREAAGVDRARALLLVTSSDAANLETALDVRRTAPRRVRIVMRLGSDKLAGRLSHDFGIDAVLSPPVLAAPAFTRAALDAAAPPPGSGERRRTSPPGPGASRLPRRLSLAGRRAAGYAPRREPAFVVAVLAVLFLTGVAVFQHQLELPLVDAIYFTSAIVTTVGFGDYNLQHEPPPVKLFGSLLMFGGITLIAVLSSLLTNFFLSGSAARLRAERVARACRDHVILCGLGSVGFEIAEDLLARRARVVVVDETPGDVHWANLSSRIPLLVGDATRPDVLLRAGIDRAHALIAATSEDAVNLEIGLVAQSVAEERRPPHHPLRLVLRCFDPELAERIHAASAAYTLLSAAEIAAPVFVARALARD
jgi:Trk K+ transport system NAD-binding subunit